MRKRTAILCAAQVLIASSTVAEELSPEQARAFVVGKLFAYSCFDGTAGMGRIFADGSVVGTITPGGIGEPRFSAPYRPVRLTTRLKAERVSSRFGSGRSSQRIPALPFVTIEASG